MRFMVSFSSGVLGLALRFVVRRRDEAAGVPDVERRANVDDTARATPGRRFGREPVVQDETALARRTMFRIGTTF
jgi:hypothetical protein